MGGMCPNASENGQISPSTIVRAARGDGSRPNRASVLLEGRKNINTHPSSGAIWRIPVKGKYRLRALTCRQGALCIAPSLSPSTVPMNFPFKVLWEFPLANSRFWLTLGWMDVVQSYRRTLLGPLWITLNLSIFVAVMTFVYGALFGVPAADYSGYVVCGMIAWFWISALLTEVGTTFINYSQFIRGAPMRKIHFIWAMAYKQLVVLAHHLVVYVFMVLFGAIQVTVYTLLAIPAIALIFLLSVPVTAVASILFVRYRDLQRLVSSSLLAILMVTPIFWQPSMISGWRTIIIHLNPFYYLVELLRSPLLGRAPDPTVVAIVIGMTLFFWTAGSFFYKRYERYVVFWI